MGYLGSHFGLRLPLQATSQHYIKITYPKIIKVQIKESQISPQPYTSDWKTSKYNSITPQSFTSN